MFRPTELVVALIAVAALVAAGAWALVGDRRDDAAGQIPGMGEVPAPGPVREPDRASERAEAVGRLPGVPDGPLGTLFGVHIQVNERNVEAAKAAVSQLEADFGRKLDIHHTFFPWDREFPTELHEWDLRHGRIPMISWNGRGVYTHDIAAGKHDGFIRKRAAAVKELDGRVLIRWFWEMDGNNKAEWAVSGDDYIGAWRRIVRVFREEGAHNVEWVWCPNASAFRTGVAQTFYPGSAYVDWICGDGYNWAPGRPGDQWRPFRDIVDGFYQWAVAQGKPVMLGEYGVQERKPGEKAAWIVDMGRTIKEEFPLLRAIVYFDADKDHDWRMHTSPESYAAFRELANDPWFSRGAERLLGW